MKRRGLRSKCPTTTAIIRLSYNKYLRVQDLINLQDCLSDPAHHDELLFITVHQAYELWFKQILHELDAAIQFMEDDRVLANAA